MARLKTAWDKLSMNERALFIKLGLLHGLTDLNDIKGYYNLYSNGGEEEILNKVNSSNANFVQRLKDPNRKNIPDWESPTDRISTHKLSVGTDENGNHYIFPEVQEINGELIDFTRPPYHRFAGEISAEMKGDTVRIPSLEDAIKFTESYKQYYSFNNGGDLVHKYDGELIGLNLELNRNIITTLPITLFGTNVPVEPFDVNEAEKIRMDKVYDDAWALAAGEELDTKTFNKVYEDFKQNFFNIYSTPLTQELQAYQEYLDTPRDLYHIDFVLPFMQQYYSTLAGNNPLLQQLLDSFDWNYPQTVVNRVIKELSLMQPDYQRMVDNVLEGLTYAESYFTSPGFLDRLRNFDQEYLYLDIPSFETILHNLEPTITFDPTYNNANSNLVFGLLHANFGTAAHELAHKNMVYNSKDLYYDIKDYANDKNSLYYSPYYGFNYQLITPEILTILKPSNYTNTHDAEISESYSDLMRTRALLEKLGIYSSTQTGQTFTEDLYDLYLNTEAGKTDRFLLLHTKQQVLDALNLIASNTNTTNPFETQNGMLAAFGGKLNHKKSGEALGESSYIQVPSTTQTATPIYMNPLPYKYIPRLYDSGTITIDKTANIKDMLLLFNDSPFMGITRLVDPTGLVSIPDAIIDLKLLYDTPTTERTVYDYVNGLASVASVIPGGSFVGDAIKIDNWKQGLDLAQQTLEKTFIPKLINWALDSQEYHDRKHKKSTGGPLYPFSFEKNPFLKTPVVRYDEGGQKQDASNPGGYTDEQLNKNYLIWKTYDPTGGLNFFNYIASQNSGNLARGEENEYWKEYLGLNSAVPLMNSNAYTEWDKQIEALKTQNGELTSDFYGTTPRMDYNILALADTLMLGNMVRNYEEYDKMYDLPHIETITQAYEQAKNILNNPNQWTFVDGEIPIGGYRYDSKTSETNPLGMLSHFGMKWVPEENALYMHDTYDFPNKVYTFTDIPIRPREMKIRSKINFDPIRGSWLLRSPVNYNTQIPVTVTK